MFHDIRDLNETDFPKRYELKSFLRKKQFEHQLNYIVSNYTIIPSTYLHQIDYKDNKKYAILTFDDGLLDHYYVYKLLKQKNISGTFFIPKLPITEGKMIPTNKIQFILAAVREDLLVTEILSYFEDKKSVWDIYSQTKWKDNWWSKEMIFITNILRDSTINNFNNYECIDYLFKKYVHQSEQEFSKSFYLTQTHLEEMSNNNMIIGGHGNTSENLLLLIDFEDDINTSRGFVSNYSNNFIFAYPNGGYNSKVKECLKKNNCRLSFTVEPMTVTDIDTVDYLEFPRYDAPQKLSLV
jgi:hypothetical protein